MAFWTIEKIIKATGGSLIQGPASSHADSVPGFSTDSRQRCDDLMFVALAGEAFDGHDYVGKAVEQGAKSLLIHRRDPQVLRQVPKHVSVILVGDSLRALQNLGKFRRDNFAGPVIGITGSNGKSSTKEFTKTILSQKYKVHASPGSFNNHWGVSLSILSMPDDCEVLVLEMGMSAPLEIKKHCLVARPNIVVVTMVGSSHIGALGSQENIANAKREIYENADKGATLIFNLENEWTRKMFERVVASEREPKRKVLTFGAFTSGVDISLRAIKQNIDSLEIEGSIIGLKNSAHLQVFGRHNVVNLMAASALASSAGMKAEDIWAALPKCRSTWGRNQLVELPSGTRVLFDGYNANPESMSVLIKNIFETTAKGKKFAVLADMLELGDHSNRFHFELGKLVGETDLDGVWFYGAFFKDFERGIRSAGFSKSLVVTDSYKQEVAFDFGSMLKPDDIAVIKGSRGMKLERVLMDWYPDWKQVK